MIPRGYILRWLVLPCLAAAIFTLLGSYLTDGWVRDLLLGLGTTFLGFLLAAVYVDEVLRRHERREWAAVHRLVVRALLDAADRLGPELTMFAYGLVPRDDPKKAELEASMPPSDPESAQLHLLETTLAEQGQRMFATVDAQSARRLAGAVRAAGAVVERAIDHHGARMRPDLVAAATRVVRSCGDLAPELDATPSDDNRPSSANLGSLSANRTRSLRASEAALELVRGLVALVHATRGEMRPAPGVDA